jgi:hypothetical protein
MFSLPIIAEGAIVGMNLVISAIFIILPPTVVGAVLGYRVSIRYPDAVSESRQNRAGVTAVLTVLMLFIIQAVFVVFLFTIN